MEGWITVILGIENRSRSIFQEGGLGTVLLTIWILTILSLWGFAFFPATELSLEWMSRTQYVCFGTLSNGLPAAQGWMLLILGPMLLFSFMYATHAEELQKVPNTIRNSNAAKILFLILLCLLMLVAHWTGTKITNAIRLARIGYQPTEQNLLPEDYPKANLQVPPFQLVDQTGAAVTEKIFSGKVSILTFAFAHCSTVCPVLIKDSLDAYRRLNSERVQVVVITIDPWRDTPSSLSSLAKTWSFPEKTFLLSGKPDDVLKTLQQFQIITERDLKTGDIVHAAQVMIVDPTGRVQYSFLNPTIDWLTSASKRVLKDL